MRKEPSQTIRTLRRSCSVWSSDEDEKSEYQLLHIFRPVFDIHTEKKCSEYLDLFCRMNDMKLSQTMAYKTRKTVNRLECKQLHFLMWCQNDHGRNKLHIELEKPKPDQITERNITMSVDKRIAFSKKSYGIFREESHENKI